MYAIRKHEDELFKHLKELEEKSKFVDWNKRERQEHFGLIAKRLEGEEKLKDTFAMTLRIYKKNENKFFKHLRLKFKF